MLYSDLVNQTLRLIDEFSKKGVANPVIKTADYRLKIPDAVNEICQDLANGMGRLNKELLIVNDTATYPTETTLALPADWLKLSGVMQQIQNTWWTPFIDYRINSISFIYNSLIAGKIIVSYYRKPTSVTVVDTSAPTVLELAQVIDVIPDAEYIVPSGVAGKILMNDNPAYSGELLNYYEVRKFLLNPGKPIYGVEVICDVYGGL